MIDLDKIEKIFRTNVFINKKMYPEKDLSFNTLDDVYKVKPKTLFKYFSDEPHNVDSILNKTIFCNNPKNFNDPYDCGYTELDFNVYKKNVILFFLKYNINIDEHIKNSSIDLLIHLLSKSLCENNLKFKSYGEDEATNLRLKTFEKKLINKANKELNGKNDNYKMFWDTFIDEILDSEINSRFITCFTRTNTNLLLWAHYADKHKGYCLEYDLEENDILSNNIFPVVYSLNKKSSGDIVSSFFRDIRNIGDLYINFLLRKSYHWMYEDEWRLILKENNDDKCNGGILAKLNSIKAIYFGTKMSDERKKQLYSQLKDNKIKFYNMKMSEEEYNMDFEEYNMDFEEYKIKYRADKNKI